MLSIGEEQGHFPVTFTQEISNSKVFILVRVHETFSHKTEMRPRRLTLQNKTRRSGSIFKILQNKTKTRHSTVKTETTSLQISNNCIASKHVNFVFM